MTNAVDGVSVPAMTLTNEEIKEVGLAVSNAVAFGDADVYDLVRDLSRDDLVALVEAVTEVYIASASRTVEFRNWIRTLAEEAAEVGPNSPVTPVLFAVYLATEMTLG